MDHNKILGVVLAGGKSQRFGQDKSQVKFQGKMLIDHILSEIIDQFKEILIVTNKPINFMKSKKIFTTKDFKEDLGPLGGVLSAMKWVKENNKKYKWISTFPTDTPFFTKNELKINIIGLMCIPPISSDPNSVFSLMKKLKIKFGLNELSMGMSSDYLEAVEKESTFIRIGSKIFGQRN